jgi:hypothetical protein
LIRRAGFAVAFAAALTGTPVAHGSPGLASSAHSEDAWRVAVVVGNNVGSGSRPPLRYAEDDADKFGRVLTELGGFRSADVHVLSGQPLAVVVAAFKQLGQQIAAQRAQGRRAVVLFYFSGHSDGQALEIGRDAWPFAEVRAALADLSADIRLAIVDTCKSGALLARKGGTPGPAFDIRFTDDLATSGEAVLTSSAADEMALESREIHGSFFSHHLVSGLRGAADSSGDGRVTLNEAYRYAFVNTLLATSGTLSGPQHPAYDYSISGQGELVLTQMNARQATLTLPDGFERILIADAGRHILVAELSRQSAHRIALSAGQYFVQARRGQLSYEARIQLKEGAVFSLAESDLQRGSSLPALAKGGDLATPAAAPALPAGISLHIAGGVSPGAADAVSWMPALRFGLRHGGAKRPRQFGWQADLDLGSLHRPGFRESKLLLGAGAFVGATIGRNQVRASWRLVGGPLRQQVDEGPSFTAWAMGTGPAIAATFPIVGEVGLMASVGVDGVRYRRDDRAVLALWGDVFVGIELGGF